MKSNTLKHAKATEAFLQLICQPEKLSILYEDNGVGFEARKTQYDGLGMTNLHARVAMYSGNIDLSTALGEGVSYMITLKFEPISVKNHQS